MKSILKKPSAFLPMLMSLAALSLVLGSIAIFGVIRETDEGVGAHIWQILMAGQLPIIGFFVVKYLPSRPKEVFAILGLQILGILAACAPVFFFKL